MTDDTQQTDDLEWIADAADLEDTISGPGGLHYTHYPLYKASRYERFKHWAGHHISHVLARLGMLDPYDAWL